MAIHGPDTSHLGEVRSLSFPVLIYSCAHCGCAQESLLEHLLSKGSALTPYAPAGASLVGRVDDTTRASLLCKVCVLTHTHTHPHIQYVYAHTDTHTHVLIVRGSTLTRTLVQYFPEDELEPQAAAPRPSAPFTPAGGPTVCMRY